ncbi:MAG: hypothetical protein HYR90_01410 [Candidatus Andersenbacteria bacterium]|nr:hypothetical protein [Candidatus Andersenbacteria bacterium]MBI3250815.1 hypothetical protein [Candidatus Andersenbacteria bacterium]
MKQSEIYMKCRSVLNGMYSSELDPKQGAVQLIELLSENGRRLRRNDHRLIRINFLHSDKSDYLNNSSVPLAVGFVYMKPDNTPTQDIYLVHPDGFIDYCRNDRELAQKYPDLVGMHKKELSIVGEQG